MTGDLSEWCSEVISVEGQDLGQLDEDDSLNHLGPNPLSDAQHRITQMVQSRKTQLVRHAVSDLSHR